MTKKEELPDIPAGMYRVESADVIRRKHEVVEDCHTQGQAMLMADEHNLRRLSRTDPVYLVFNHEYGLVHDHYAVGPYPNSGIAER